MRICDVCVVNYKCTGEGKYQVTVWNLKLVSEEMQQVGIVQSNSSMHHYECIALCKELSGD